MKVRYFNVVDFLNLTLSHIFYIYYSLIQNGTTQYILLDVMRYKLTRTLLDVYGCGLFYPHQ